MATNEQQAGYRQEKITARLEQAMTPDDVVYTPKKKSKGRTGNSHELDVVRESGKKPRQHTDIIEIQKRASGKVGTTDMDHWVKKKERLGAARLIGVSELGFTRDVIRDLKHDHPNGDVLLGLLTTLDPEDYPDFLDKDLSYITRMPQLTFKSLPGILTECGKKILLDESFLMSDKIYNGNDYEKISVNTIIRNLFRYDANAKSKILGPEHMFTINFDGILLIVKKEDMPDQVDDVIIQKMVVGLECLYEEEKRDVEVFKYEEIFPQAGIWGHCVINQVLVDGDVVDLPTLYIPDEDGTMVSLGQPLQEGLDLKIVTPTSEPKSMGYDKNGNEVFGVETLMSIGKTGSQ